MPYDGQLLARARAELEKRRSENEAEHNRRVRAVYARIPEIERIDTDMRGEMRELLRLTITRPADMKERIAALEWENLENQARRAELLVAHGLPMDYLDEIVSCPKCRDSGNGPTGPCDCLEKLYNAELTRELGVLLRRGDECFENFDLTLYPDSYDPQRRCVPRELAEIALLSCRKFAENFPAVASNLLLQGEPGLGKTYLSACVARVVAKKGCSVCYDTAASALAAFERQKFARSPEEQEQAGRRVERMLSCDLMILDDLGTEMISPMSVSALYTLVNTRLVNGKKLIISTNCSDEQILKNYGGQIASRLAGEFLCLPFAGKDIRLLKKGV